MLCLVLTGRRSRHASTDVVVPRSTVLVRWFRCQSRTFQRFAGPCRRSDISKVEASAQSPYFLNLLGARTQGTSSKVQFEQERPPRASQRTFLVRQTSQAARALLLRFCAMLEIASPGSEIICVVASILKTCSQAPFTTHQAVTKIHRRRKGNIRV